MIKIDHEGESFVFENDWDVAIPLSYEMVGGELKVSVFPMFESVAEELASRFGDDPFSLECFDFLSASISFEMLRRGYIEEKHEKNSWGHVFRYEHAREFPEYVRECKAEDEENNITSYDIKATVESGRLCFGAEVDGKIVAIAAAHAAEDIDGVLEIGVECALDYRRHGYASACASALASAMAARGITAEYRVRHTNVASVATARSAGFEDVGSYYYYVFVRREL